MALASNLGSTDIGALLMVERAGESRAARSFKCHGAGVNRADLTEPACQALPKRLPDAAGMLFPDVMTDERALRAIQRIEQALARIEAVANRPPAARDDHELRELREVHQALRGKVEGAISQIDRLLATAESA